MRNFFVHNANRVIRFITDHFFLIYKISKLKRLKGERKLRLDKIEKATFWGEKNRKVDILKKSKQTFIGKKLGRNLNFFKN